MGALVTNTMKLTNKKFDQPIGELATPNLAGYKFKNYTKDQLEIIKQNFLKSNDFKVENVKVGKYKGYLLSNKKDGNSIVYLNIDDKENVVLSANMNAVYSDKLKEKIKKGTSAEKIIYNLTEVKSILRSIEYNK